MRPIGFCCAVALIALTPASALAAQRTFVASNGSDSNPCSRTAPCRAFAAALSLTDPNGEIVVLDSSGYGGATITQSVSIVAPPGVYAGVSVFAGAGIVVNGPGVHVKLQGLTINGQGGTHGVQFLQGASLSLASMTIAGLTGNCLSMEGAFETLVVRDSSIDACGNAGVAVLAPGKASLSRVTLARNDTGVMVWNGGVMSIEDSVIARSGTDGAIAVAGVGQTAQLSVSRTTVSANGATGVAANSFGSGAVAHVAVADSTVTDNQSNGAGATATSGGTTTLTLQRVLVTRSGAGISAQGATVVVGGSTITRNAIGIQISGGSVRSAGDNLVDTNGTNLAGGAITPAVVM